MANIMQSRSPGPSPCSIDPHGEAWDNGDLSACITPRVRRRLLRAAAKAEMHDTCLWTR
jgi:hypothetical protein